jgi:TonB family protein
MERSEQTQDRMTVDKSPLRSKPLNEQNGLSATVTLKWRSVRYYSFAMRKIFLRRSANIFVLFISLSAIASDKHTASRCDKPREILSAPQLSKEEQSKARKIRAQGMVDISISEDGDVIEAKVVRASSREAVDLLLSFARSAKFKPRTGCGTTHTAINYTLAGQ